MTGTSNAAVTKAVATGTSRAAASEVLFPRILGAVEAPHCRHRWASDSLPELMADRGDFYIHIQLLAEPGLHFGVWWERELVMAGLATAARSKASLTWNLRLKSWDRTAKVRSWQAELFDTFPRDSDWLIRAPAGSWTPESISLVVHLPRWYPGAVKLLAAGEYSHYVPVSLRLRVNTRVDPAMQLDLPACSPDPEIPWWDQLTSP
jgi:hypothetical protein